MTCAFAQIPCIPDLIDVFDEVDHNLTSCNKFLQTQNIMNRIFKRSLVAKDYCSCLDPCSQPTYKFKVKRNCLISSVFFNSF